MEIARIVVTAIDDEVARSGVTLALETPPLLRKPHMALGKVVGGMNQRIIEEPPELIESAEDGAGDQPESVAVLWCCGARPSRRSPAAGAPIGLHGRKTVAVSRTEPAMTDPAAAAG